MMKNFEKWFLKHKTTFHAKDYLECKSGWKAALEWARYVNVSCSGDQGGGACEVRLAIQEELDEQS